MTWFGESLIKDIGFEQIFETRIEERKVNWTYQMVKYDTSHWRLDRRFLLRNSRPECGNNPECLSYRSLRSKVDDRSGTDK